jgi:hypothetical protein
MDEVHAVKTREMGPAPAVERAHFARWRQMSSVSRILVISTVVVSLAWLGLSGLGPNAPAPARAQTTAPENPSFRQLWQRSDGPVAAGALRRPWTWGPAPIFTGAERYGVGRRQVQYFDKGRMEIRDLALLPGSPGYVSGGPVVRELVSGQIDLGQGAVQSGAPAWLPVAGDPVENPHAPAYASFRFVASLDGSRRVPPRVGQPVIETIARDGFISANPALGGAAAIAAYHPETGHNIPDVFVDFLSRVGPVWENDQLIEAPLVDVPVMVGAPLTEAYWTQISMNGAPTDVMMQLFERRTLLYFPGRAGDDRVQFGDAGRHAFEWRYRQGVPPGQAGVFGDLALTVTGVTRASIEGGPPPFEHPGPTPTPTPRPRRRTPTPGPPTPTPLPPNAVTARGIFVIVEFDVTNVGRSASTLGLRDLVLVDGDGRTFDVHLEATELASARLGLTGDRSPLPPGVSIRAVRVWEVPPEARGLMVAPGFGEKPALTID